MTTQQKPQWAGFSSSAAKTFINHSLDAVLTTSRKKRSAIDWNQVRYNNVRLLRHTYRTTTDETIAKRCLWSMRNVVAQIDDEDWRNMAQDIIDNLTKECTHA